MKKIYILLLRIINIRGLILLGKNYFELES